MAYSFKGATDGRGNLWAPFLLKAQDIPLPESEITVLVTGIQKPPKGFSAVCIFDIEGAPGGRTMFPCNVTNAKTIVAAVGDDLEAVFGKSLLIRREFVEYNGRAVPGMVVREVLEPDAAAEVEQTVKRRRGGRR